MRAEHETFLNYLAEQREAQLMTEREENELIRQYGERLEDEMKTKQQEVAKKRTDLRRVNAKILISFQRDLPLTCEIHACSKRSKNVKSKCENITKTKSISGRRSYKREMLCWKNKNRYRKSKRRLFSSEESNAESFVQHWMIKSVNEISKWWERSRHHRSNDHQRNFVPPPDRSTWTGNGRNRTEQCTWTAVSGRSQGVDRRPRRPQSTSGASEPQANAGIQ